MKAENCSLCGECNSACPVWKVVFNETVAPRGFAVLEKKEILDKVFYICSLCGACYEECPINVDLKLRKIRQLLVEKKIETKVNKEMIESLRVCGNPYNNGEKVDKLFF